MTDRLRDQISYYLPHDPDPSLEFSEYYYLQYTMGNPRVIRVHALDVLPIKDGTEYGIYTKHGSRLVRVDAGYDSPFRGVRMGDLYDNKEDCRDQTHGGAEWWPELREAQREEAEHANQPAEAH